MSRDAARLTTWVRDAVTGAGARWLPAQRWFGGKSRQIAAVTLDEVKAQARRILNGDGLIVTVVGRPEGLTN